MKRLLLILALSASLGAAAYLISYHIAQNALCDSPDWQSPTAWMRQEFHLNDAQYAQVKKMEGDYHPHCTEMCDRIQQSHLALKKIILANNGTKAEKVWKTPDGEEFKVELVIIDNPVAMIGAYTSGDVLSGAVADPAKATKTRDDLMYTFSAGVQYAFTANLSAQLGYAYDLGRNAQPGISDAGRVFNHQLISLGVTFAF